MGSFFDYIYLLKGTGLHDLLKLVLLYLFLYTIFAKKINMQFKIYYGTLAIYENHGKFTE
jgi:hypothetical protein